MATFRRRGERWFAEVCVNGKRRGKTFITKKEANEWARLAEIHLVDATEHTLREAARKFKAEIAAQTKAAQNSAQMAVRAADMLPDKPLSDFTRGDFSKWKNARLEAVSDSTVRREMVALKAVLRAAVEEWGWLNTNPIVGIKSPPEHEARQRGVAQHEIDAIVNALGYVEGVRPWLKKQQVAICFLLGIETAMRAGEMVSLTWDQVFIDEKYVQLNKTKNGDRRQVPLSSRAIELFGLLEGSGKVFDLTEATRDTIFRKGRDKTEYKDVHFHDSRAEGITRLSKKLDVLELAKAIGHRDLKSLMHYYAASVSDLASKLD